MTGWDREYLANKDEYLKIFDGAMQQEQEQNVEFLEKSLTKITGRKYAIACSNGTDALHFALISLGIKPGDEVLTTQFSWISTASCISMVGATPVFCEPNILNYHMDIKSIRRMYTNKTKAIVYPHLFGNMSDTKEILDFCKQKNIAFIEDACQALGASLNGINAGSIGDVSTLSFNANKVVAGVAGGGAILTNGDTEIFKRLRKHGEHKQLGYNSKMLLFNAEFINFRLKKLGDYIKKRQELAKYYDEKLKEYVTIQMTPDNLNHNYHKYVVRFQNREVRDRVKAKIGQIHYDKPISDNIMYKDIEHRKDDDFITRIVCDSILTLPLHPFMKKEEQDKVINTILLLI